MPPMSVPCTELQGGPGGTREGAGRARVGATGPGAEGTTLVGGTRAFEQAHPHREDVVGGAHRAHRHPSDAAAGRIRDRERHRQIGARDAEAVVRPVLSVHPAHGGLRRLEPALDRVAHRAHERHHLTRVELRRQRERGLRVLAAPEARGRASGGEAPLAGCRSGRQRAVHDRREPERLDEGADRAPRAPRPVQGPHQPGRHHRGEYEKHDESAHVSPGMEVCSRRVGRVGPAVSGVRRPRTARDPRLLLDRADVLQLAIEIALADAQDGGRLLAMAAALVEHALDVAPLDLLERRHLLGIPVVLERGLEPHAHRKVLGLDRAAIGQNERPLDHVLQLADVPRPQVALEHLDRLLGGLHGALGNDRRAADEVIHQQRDVALSLAQRRDVHGEHVEPVVEVLAEGAVLHHLLERAIGGGDHAHVHLDVHRPADSPKGAGLQHPQQLHLQLRREFRDLVQEDGAPVGDLEQPVLEADRAGVGALLVPEQLALEQVLVQRGAVHHHERLARAAALPVHGTRHQLLARAALAPDEHGRVGVARLA